MKSGKKKKNGKFKREDTPVYHGDYKKPKRTPILLISELEEGLNCLRNPIQGIRSRESEVSNDLRMTLN